jgi:ABC-type cobalamin/Fe3+-siderophores transport system ATPase subunit
MNPEQQVARDRVAERYMQMILGSGDASAILAVLRNARQEKIPPEEVADRVCAMLQTEDERKTFVGVTEAVLRGLDIVIEVLKQMSWHQESIRDKVLKITDLKHLADLYAQHG